MRAVVVEASSAGVYYRIDRLTIPHFIFIDEGYAELYNRLLTGMHAVVGQSGGVEVEDVCQYGELHHTNVFYPSPMFGRNTEIVFKSTVLL